MGEQSIDPASDDGLYADAYREYHIIRHSQYKRGAENIVEPIDQKRDIPKRESLKNV